MDFVHDWLSVGAGRDRAYDWLKLGPISFCCYRLGGHQWIELHCLNRLKFATRLGPFRLLCLLLLASCAFAQPVPAPVFPGNFVFLGAAYAQDAVGVPNFNAVASYGKRLAVSGTYSYTSYDAYFIRGVNKQIQLIKAERTGILQYMRSIGPIMLFAVIDGGLSQSNSATDAVLGGSFSGGGFGVIPVKKSGFAFVAGARIVASTIAPNGNKTSTIAELGGTFSWGQ